MRSDVHTIARHAGGAQLAWLLTLTLAVAATEGLGFVLLVPLLDKLALGPDDALSGWLRWTPGLGEILLLFVLLVTLRSFAELARALAAQRVRARVIDGLRHEALSGLLHARWSALSAMRQGENRALLITTIDRAGYSVDLASDLLRVVLSLAAVALAALLISPVFALSATAIGALVFALHARFRRRAQAIGTQLTARYAHIHVRLEEALDALRLIKSVNREERTLAELADSFTSMRQVERAYIRDSGIARAGVQVFAAMLLALFVWLSVGAGGMDLPLLLPLVALGLRAVPLLVALQQTAQRWNHERPALAAAGKLLDQTRTSREPSSGCSSAPPLEQTLKLEKVGFGRGIHRPILREIDCTIPAGSLVALTGVSGSGKSTLADIMGGLIPPDQGRILLDGQPLAESSLPDWRRRVSYVHQNAVLFSGSIRDNLLWAAPEASEEGINAALDSAHAGFVHDLPDGVDSLLGDFGHRLSGGERQRIALARALLRKPDLLILDEPTSALDSQSEAEIARALTELKGATTILLICHRGSLTALADIRLELADGRLAESAAREIQPQFSEMR